MDAVLVSQYVLSGVVIGVLYSLMALGITFIYSVMRMINWAMGEFFMIGSYVQYALIVALLGPSRWTSRPSRKTDPMATGRASHQRDGPSAVTIRAYCT